MAAFAAVLGLAGIAAFLLAHEVPKRARVLMRFCGALYGALAASLLFSIAPLEVAPIVTTLVAALLTLAVFEAVRRAPPAGVAALLSAVAGIAGMAAAASGMTVIAIVPQFLALSFALALSRRALFAWRAVGLYLALGALSLMAAGLSLLAADFRLALPLFASAGLLGFVLALAKSSELLVEMRR